MQTPEIRTAETYQASLQELITLCERYLAKGIDTFAVGDITIEIIASHGGGLYTQSRMIIDYLRGSERVRGYILLEDKAFNHPGSATSGETFDVDANELNQVLAELQAATAVMPR